MYNKLKKYKWKFFNGGPFPINGIDANTYPAVLTPEQLKQKELEELRKIEQNKKLEEQVAAQAAAQNGQQESLFNKSNITQGISTGIQSLQNAKLNDGKITGDELASSSLDVASSLSGPYGQISNTAITIGETLLGDELYQGLGEGVEYEKGASRAAKGALKGAAFGAKVGGPYGALIGAVGGAGLNLIGQGKRKRDAMNEFEKRRAERVRNMNEQSKGIYSEQFQTFYKKGGEAVIKIKKENKGRFTNYCKRQGYTGVTQECINEAKKSKSKSLRKQAVFAENVRKFKR